jgi:hypothetical protein
LATTTNELLTLYLGRLELSVPAELLRQIRDGALDERASLSTLLRNCYVLADTLSHSELAEWVNRELDGYKHINDIPRYRILPGIARGHFDGGFGATRSNIPIPKAVMPQEFERFAERMYLFQPIAAIERLGKSTETVLTMNWPPDLVLEMSTKLLEGYVLVNASQSCGIASVHGVLDVVRTRVLQFALRLQKEISVTGDSLAIPESKLTPMFRDIIINGNVTGNVAVGSHLTQTAGNIAVAVGDIESLRQQLRVWGIPKVHVDDLEAEIPRAPSAEAERSSWLSRIASKMLSGGATIAQGVSADLIAKAIGIYLGMPA